MNPFSFQKDDQSNTVEFNPLVGDNKALRFHEEKVLCKDGEGLVGGLLRAFRAPPANRTANPPFQA